MKLANFFLMTVLVGTLGVLGCSDDPPATGNGGNGGSGTAGTGGSGTAGTGGSGTAGTGGSGTAGTGGAPECTDGELCCLEVCLINDVLYGNCLREYDSCIDLGGEVSTCEAAAEETCTI